MPWSAKLRWSIRASCPCSSSARLHVTAHASLVVVSQARLAPRSAFLAPPVEGSLPLTAARRNQVSALRSWPSCMRSDMSR